MEKKEGKEIIVAIIGAIALIISALITGFFSSAPTRTIIIQATQTPEVQSIQQIIPTPTAQTISTALPTPVNLVSSPNLPIPVRKNELVLSITGAIIAFAFASIFIYLPQKRGYRIMKIVPMFMVSLGVIAPFVLVWLSYFFSIPQDIPFALVLFVSLMVLSMIFWFGQFIFDKLSPIMVILIGASPIYITAFGFTNLSQSAAFVTASLITGAEILYVVLVWFIDERMR